MTRIIFISIFFLAMMFRTSFTASATTRKSNTIVSVSNDGTDHTASKEPVSSQKSLPVVPSTKTVPHESHEEKGHAPKTEELPHIHRFHKERVKKVKRHHKKYWFLGMLLVVICHAAILFMAYMHAIHP